MAAPTPSPSVPDPDANLKWHEGLSRYQWFVLIVATLAWLFDTMDQQFFNLARKPAMIDLLNIKPTDPLVDQYAGYSTSIFLTGWAIGGILFGVLGDKIGRARTLTLTVFTYSLCTGLSAFSFGFWDFAFYRFITGLGVGGAFAAGVTLVAEVMPDRSRTKALGTFQAFSAVGNMVAAFTTIGLGTLGLFSLLQGGVPWRIMFLVGALPALLAVFIMRRLEEPERWREMAKARAEGRMAGDPQARAGSIADLFRIPRWRHNTLVGLALAFAGVVAVWGIGFFSFDLARNVYRPQLLEYAASIGLEDKDQAKYVNDWLTIYTGGISAMQNLGAFFGIYSFAVVTTRLGRRATFALFFVLAILSTLMVFAFLGEVWHIFTLIPLMGFCQLALFGGYAIYFPELFPTRLRSTGVSFCYNVGRLVAAIAPFMLGVLSNQVYGWAGPNALRYSGMTMCAFLLIGLAVLPFAPETQGQPLPEEDVNPIS